MTHTELNDLLNPILDDVGLQNVLDSVAAYCATAAIGHEKQAIEEMATGNNDVAQSCDTYAEDWHECGRAVSLASDEPMVVENSRGYANLYKLNMEEGK
jgi:hypothetical protein